VFPELSLTGYEPELGEEWAISANDERLSPLRAMACRYQMSVVVGAPLRNAEAKPGLGAMVFAADGAVQIYSKMHLGGTEPNYFAAGQTPLSFATRDRRVGIAICADSSRPSHPEAYAAGGCDIYAAGVFLNAQWYATDAPRLADYASRFRMLVVMANHGASSGRHVSVGKSAVWAPGGAVLAEAGAAESCLVIATRARDLWAGEVVGLGHAFI
jgi:predicted amidohydrolase